MSIKIAAGYVRCSTDMQDESVGQQKTAILEWAEKNGYKVIQWFEDEGKSGVSYEKRPAFMQMVYSVQSGKTFEYLLCYDESRWGRAGNPRVSTYWKVHFERHGVKVRIINSRSKADNDIGSYVTEVVESAEAGEYSRKLSGATMRGCKSRAQTGHSAGGSAPYGYKRIAVDPLTGELIRELPPGTIRRRLEELVKLELGDHLEVDTVRRIFEMKAGGRGLKTIAVELNDKRIPCPKRGKWRNKDQKWSAGTIRAIIQNPVYYGAKAYNRFPKNKLSGLPRGRRNPQSEWILVEGAHHAIVAKDLYERANVARSYKYAGGAAKVISSPYLLSGLIQCTHCGFNYVGYTRGSKELRYYADSGYINKGKSVCSWHALGKERIEEYVLGTIEQNVLSSAVATRFHELIDRYLDSYLTENGSAGQEVEAALKSNATKLDNLLSLIEKGISTDTILPRVKELEAEKGRLEREWQKVQHMGADQRAVKSAAEQAEAFMASFPDKWRKASIPDQKLLMRRVVRRIAVDRAHGDFTCTFYRLPKINNPIVTAILQNFGSGVHSRVCPEQDLNLHDLTATSS